MLDRHLIGDVARISPEAPVPVLAVQRDENRRGGAANAAANVSAMLQPDILVEGGDYNVHSIVGYDEVTARGGRVVALDFHDRYSSTRVIQKIGEANSA